MFRWFAELSIAPRIYACIAVPCSILLVLQVLLVLFCRSPYAQEKKRAIICNSLAMLTLGGWCGLLCLELGLPLYASIPLSVVVGVGAYFLSAYFVQCVLAEQVCTSLAYADMIGKQGQVFLSLPDRCKGEGKVLFATAEGGIELAAVTTEDLPIRTGAQVIAVAVDALDRLVVATKKDDAE